LILVIGFEEFEEFEEFDIFDFGLDEFNCEMIVKVIKVIPRFKLPYACMGDVEF
jgi:hypothetical protein